MLADDHRFKCAKSAMTFTLNFCQKAIQLLSTITHIANNRLHDSYHIYL